MFSGTLEGAAAGQGAFNIRSADGTVLQKNAGYVGVGDLYACAGQSNMSGRGSSNRAYSHATLRATLYGNDDTWKNLTDPYDRNTDQVDTVSADADASGSFIPLLATEILSSQSAPVGFLPCARGSTSISQWMPGADHEDRDTLYGNLVSRVMAVGGVKAVLWWQGERDCVLGTSQTDYYNALTALATAIESDLGVPMVVARLQTVTGEDNTAVNAAINAAITDHANIIAGPDFSDITTGDGLHFVTNTELQTAADRWWSALDAAFYV